MKIVLDTNILLQSIGHSSRFRPIWNTFLNEVVDLYIVASILLEYGELLSERTSKQVGFNVISLIGEAPNAHFIDTSYEQNAIEADPDDNKFFGAAVAAKVDYLVTNDSHFNPAKKLSFLKVNIVSAEEFLDLLTNLT